MKEEKPHILCVLGTRIRVGGVWCGVVCVKCWKKKAAQTANA